MPLPTPNNPADFKNPYGSNKSMDPYAYGSASNPTDRYSIKEAINTGMRAGLLSAQANILEKSFLRFIPGSGILKEKAEFKRAEMMDRRGRDPATGRKLSSEEIKERDARRIYYTATGETLATIKDDLHTLVDFFMGNDGKATTNLTPLVGSRSEEQAAEQEREDDKDAAEEQKKQESFFTKLFGGKKKKGEDSGGLMGLVGMLGTFLSSIGGLLTGGLGGLVSGVVGALTGAIGALMPFIAAVLPIALPLILAGAAGVMIANWIDGNTKRMKKAAEVRESTGMKRDAMQPPAMTEGGEKLYRVTKSVSQGKGKSRKMVSSYGTAAELGISPEDIAAGVDSEGSGISTADFITETRGGKETGLLAAGMNDVKLSGAFARQRSLTNISGDKTTSYSVGRDFDPAVQKIIDETTADGTDVSSVIPDLKNLEAAMAMYTMRFKQDIKLAKDGDPGTQQMLVDEYNNVIAFARNIQKSFDELGAVGAGRKILGKLAEKYAPFKKSIDSVMGIAKKDAYVGYWGDLYAPAAIGDDTRLNLLNPNRDFDTAKFGSRVYMGAEGESPVVSPIQSPKVPNSGIPAAADTNAQLKSMPVPSGSGAAGSVTSNIVTQTSNQMMAESPKRTGGDIPMMFNGVGVAGAF